MLPSRVNLTVPASVLPFLSAQVLAQAGHLGIQPARRERRGWKR